MLAPFFVYQRGWRELSHLSTIGWIAIVFLSVGCSAFGYLVWYGALEHVEVSRVAALLYLEPFVTFAAAIVLLHEPISRIAIAGGLLVIASVMVMQYAPRVGRTSDSMRNSAN
jgi:drug/metabolite transporter (DMT)-like permease